MAEISLPKTIVTVALGLGAAIGGTAETQYIEQQTSYGAENPLPVIGEQFHALGQDLHLVAQTPAATEAPVQAASQAPDILHGINYLTSTGINWVTLVGIGAIVGIPLGGLIYHYATNRDFREYANGIAHAVGEGVGTAAKSLIRRNPFS